MADKLTRLTQDHLEKMVAERTAELRLANAQLEKEILERRRGEEELRTAAHKWRTTFDAMRDGILLLDPNNQILQCNQAMSNILGKPMEEIVGKSCWDIMHHTSAIIDGCPALKGKKTLKRETLILLVDNRWFNVVVDPILDESGNYLGAVHIMSDITEQKRAEEEMQKLSTAVAQATDWVVITDKEGIIEYANEAAAAMSGYTREELIGKNPRILKSGQHDAHFYQELWSTIASGQPFRTIFINRKKDGELFHLNMTITPLKNGQGHITQYLSTAQDITPQLRLEERLNYLAYYDALTGLPNRTLFMDRLRQALARANHCGRPVGVITMDLDRFKFVNETFGPEVGDEVLRGVGQKLARTVRDGDTVARLGSDEFGIILVDMGHMDDIVLVLNKIRESLSHSVQAADQQVMLTFSMGIAMYPHDGEDAFTLMQNADIAFAKAKEQGGNTYQFYAPGMNIKAANFVLLGNQLLNALHRQEFLLYYQPYYQVSTGKMVGMEALIRWQHPDNGLVLPGDFIPILEDTGMIREVGEWTLREACRQLKEWQRQGYELVPVSVNFSAVQFSWPGLVAMVERVIGECGLDYHFFTAEITESAIMYDVEYTKSVLDRFKNLGMSISIDDFGTGYSSLSYLKRFPIDNLKIDVSFIREVTEEPDTATIIQAIISMAHSLDLKTIAEGVETKEQAQILRLLRCDIIQGFYYNHPLPPEEFAKLF